MTASYAGPGAPIRAKLQLLHYDPVQNEGMGVHHSVYTVQKDREDCHSRQSGPAAGARPASGPAFTQR